jgi:hypothetical protein
LGRLSSATTTAWAPTPNQHIHRRTVRTNIRRKVLAIALKIMIDAAPGGRPQQLGVMSALDHHTRHDEI